MNFRITKAIIPIAGLGKRLRPFTYAAPKAMLPLVDSSGLAKTVLHSICQEAALAGIDSLALIVSPGQQESLESYFQAVRRVSPADLPGEITFITQPTPAGFGDAVLLGREFAASEPVLIMLGDHVHISPVSVGACVRQVIDAYESLDAQAVVGVKSVNFTEISAVGVVRGEKSTSADERIYLCGDFIEKPTLPQARARLVTPGIAEGNYLAHNGIYAMSAEIFSCLTAASDNVSNANGELEFAAGQLELLSRQPKGYFLCHVDGKSYDTGTPDAYAKAFAAFRLQA